MKTSEFKIRFYGVLAIFGLLLAFSILYYADSYFRDKDTSVPLTEDEQDYIENMYPEGLPKRYW